MKHAAWLSAALFAACAAHDPGAPAAGRSASAARAPGERPPVVLSEAALRLHRSALVFDGHNDLPWQVRTKAGSSFDALDIAEPQPELHTDIPRLRRGGLGAQFWSVFVPAESAHSGAALRQTLEQIDLVRRMVERYPDVFELAGTAADVERIHRAGRIASLMGVEGGHSIEGSLAALRMLYALGVRYMTLTHSDTLEWADAATDAPRSGGLSAFGEEVVREMNRLGMLVDLSHVSVETMEDALRVSRAPVIASHSSCFALAPHPRNVSDPILRKIAANGGVVMLNFYSGFLVESAAREMAGAFDARRELRARFPNEADFEREMNAWRDEHPIESGSVHDLADHIDHVVALAGVDHVGLGSDYDGIATVPRQLEDVSCYPYVTQELLNRGYDERAIGKILGGNALRVLREAERVAVSMR